VPLKTKHLYRFGPYRLDGDEQVLLRDGQPVTLPPKDLETLFVLVENAGHIVEKEELLEKVWPGVFIEEGNLARHVFNLRQVLGDTADGRPYIETIPRRGYRFVATVQEDGEEVAAASPLPPSERPQTPITSLQNRMRLIFLVLLVVTGYFVSRRLWSRPNTPPQKVMLAVLPFVNLSGNANEDYFADGLTEEMTAQLGQFQPSKLGVIARTSTVRYKGTKETAAQIGQELGVGYLLEGSVRRGGDRVRVTAQLIQVGEQTHLWAESYERPLTDVLKIQQELAEKITHSLSIQLLPGTTAASAASHINLESHDKYLLGLHELGQGTRESENRAIQYFQKAIAKDPNDARLYSALAETYSALLTYYSSPNEVMPRAKEAALHALELDPDLAPAHVTLGDVRLFYDWDWAAGEKEYHRALDINPNSPEAQLGYAEYLATLGRFDEALSRVQQAYLFDPLALQSRNEALWIFYFSGHMPETVQQCQKTTEIEPAAGLPYALLAMAYAQMGQRLATVRAAESAMRFPDSPSVISAAASGLARVGETGRAKQFLGKALEMAKERYVCRFLVAAAYTELGEKEKALDSLEQAFLQRST
jgi:TolB-like protein/DNA-binding winged helix-turn-helix (wHTH) protein/cytochrome c-type biogenesis protein CcmH/NrfG